MKFYSDISASEQAIRIAMVRNFRKRRKGKCFFGPVDSTWFGFRHARLKVVVLQPTVVSSFGCFVFEIRVLRFRDLGASFSSFRWFVFEFWVLRASVFVFEGFVFQTTLHNSQKPQKYEICILVLHSNFRFMQKQDAVGACIWAWSYYAYDTLNMPYLS